MKKDRERTARVPVQVIHKLVNSLGESADPAKVPGPVKQFTPEEKAKLEAELKARPTVGLKPTKPEKAANYFRRRG